MSSSPVNRTTVRLVEAVSERLAQDPAAQINVSAFVRVVVDSFIASETPVENTRAIGLRLNSKTAGEPTSLAIPSAIFRHYKRYAKAVGKHSFGALVCTALAVHYFGASARPASCVTAAQVPPVDATKGYRTLLLSLDVGQTREFTRADLPTSLTRAQLNLFATAEAIRDSMPDFRITTRKTPRCLYVTRVA